MYALWCKICKFCGTAFVTEKTINNYIITTSVVNRMLILYKGSDEVVSIPKYITEIGQDAFRDNKKIKKVIVPDSVTVVYARAFSIGQSMFQGCASLEEIIIPESVHTIKENAFSHCTSLKNIIIPHSVKKSENATNNCLRHFYRYI